MSGKRAVFKCQRCKVTAESIIVDGNIHGVACPKCGARVEGRTFNTMYMDQNQYIRYRIVQDALRGTIPERRSPGVTFGHYFADIYTPPDWKFLMVSLD